MQKEGESVKNACNSVTNEVHAPLNPYDNKACNSVTNEVHVPLNAPDIDYNSLANSLQLFLNDDNTYIPETILNKLLSHFTVEQFMIIMLTSKNLKNTFKKVIRSDSRTFGLFKYIPIKQMPKELSHNICEFALREVSEWRKIILPYIETITDELYEFMIAEREMKLKEIPENRLTEKMCWLRLKIRCSYIKDIPQNKLTTEMISYAKQMEESKTVFKR